MIHNYPYTDYHEFNLDYIMNLALSSLGIHLEVSDQYLKLINAKGEEISKVIINYADTATHDEAGNDIMAYIISAGVNDNAVVFTKGDGTATTITIPFAIKADQDVNGNAITSYVKNVSVNGDHLTVTFGDGSTASITIPYAVKARDDVNGKSLTSYASIIATVGDKLELRDGNNNTIVEITVPYAVKASQDEDGDNIRVTYGTDLSTGNTTVKLTNKDGVTLSEITVPYAVKALKDNNDNELLVDYAYRLNTNGNKITVESHTGRTLNEIIVPFASLADHSNNSIESVEISGDQVVFTTYGGQSFAITIPYAVKALKDNLNNTLSATYIANVTNDPNTGKISFFAQDGTKIAELTPTVNKAVNDSYNNLIADYIKSIATDPNSDYMTVLHGTGDADTILINYATHAYKDTYDNVIGNTYIRNLAIVQDQTDNKYYLVAYNGELSELFRIDISSYNSKSLDMGGLQLSDSQLGIRQNIPNLRNRITNIIGNISTVEPTDPVFCHNMRFKHSEASPSSTPSYTTPVNGLIRYGITDPEDTIPEYYVDIPGYTLEVFNNSDVIVRKHMNKDSLPLIKIVLKSDDTNKVDYTEHLSGQDVTVESVTEFISGNTLTPEEVYNLVVNGAHVIMSYYDSASNPPVNTNAILVPNRITQDWIPMVVNMPIVIDDQPTISFNCSFSFNIRTGSLNRFDATIWVFPST